MTTNTMCSRAVGFTFLEPLECRTLMSAIPAAPLEVAATFAAATNQMQVAWLASADATAYDVLRGTSANYADAVSLGQVTGTAFTDKAPTPGASYYYFVRAVGDEGASNFSVSAQVADTDKLVLITKTVTAGELPQLFDIVGTASSTLQTVTKSAFNATPNVYYTLTNLSGGYTITEVVTPDNAIVSGSITGAVNQAGTLTAKVRASIYGVATVTLGLQLDETASITLTGSYSTVNGWGIESAITGTMNLNGYGQASAFGCTAKVNATMPTVTFAGTVSTAAKTKVTLSIAGPMTVGYDLSIGRFHSAGTLFKASQVNFGTWVFNAADLEELLG